MDAHALELLKSQDAARWRAFRAENPSWALSLEGADLSGIDLHSNDLENGWDLSNCRFDGANLAGARIVRANLSGASLRDTDLSKTDLDFSLLANCDLSGARMVRTSLRNSELQGATIAPSFVVCLLCAEAASVRSTTSVVELSCERCGSFRLTPQQLLQHVLGEIDTASLAHERTSATAALDYVEFARAHSAAGSVVTVDRCAFCREWSLSAEASERVTSVCRACGLFEMPAGERLPDELEVVDRLRICWWLRGRFDAQVLARATPTPTLIEPRNLVNSSRNVPLPDDPLDCLRALIGWIQARSRPDGDFVVVRDVDFAIAHANSRGALRYLLGQAVELGWLEKSEYVFFRLTLAGWKQALEWKRKKPDVRQVFVAMSFDPQFYPAYEALAAAIEEVGLKPMRVDELQHNDKICDRLVAEIRRSRMLIADCTHGSGNVYFEAGFALGLGLTVIWTCRESEKDALRFDTRQYAHILWKDPEDLRQKLVDRLNATLLPVE